MIVLDTGPVYAAADVDDSHHERCAEFFTTTHDRLVMPAPVVNEVCYWLGLRLGADREARFLRSVAYGEVELAVPTSTDYVRAAILVEQYADNDLGFVDAMVVAVAESLKVRKIATVDVRHFSAVRPAHIDAFELVP